MFRGYSLRLLVLTLYDQKQNRKLAWSNRKMLWNHFNVSF